MTAAPRSWLYVPAHREDRVAKALAAGADAVVLDLEDAVPADRKAAARDVAVHAAVARAATTSPDGAPRLWVRVNPPSTPEGKADLEALAGAAVDGVRVPRAESPADVAAVADHLARPVQLLVESALGLARAFELACCHPLVSGIGLGESDLAADLLVPGEEGLDWARGAVVVAARAARLPAPVQSVWTAVADLDGLRRSSERGRALGFWGRSVVHPAQLPVVHEVFTPSADEVAAARAVVDADAAARERGEVAVLDEHGRFVDPAVVARAQVVLGRSGAAGGGTA